MPVLGRDLLVNNWKNVKKNTNHAQKLGDAANKKSDTRRTCRQLLWKHDLIENNRDAKRLGLDIVWDTAIGWR